MEAKTVSRHTEAIQSRFFEAIDVLKGNGRIGGLRPFCEENGLNHTKYVNLRKAKSDQSHDTKYKLIDIDALYYIVQKGVSADWLLTGKGSMLK
jgi:hypothetical protein